MKADFIVDDHYRERIEKRLSYTEFVEEFDPPSPDDVVIMGVYSRFWRNAKRRQVLRTKAVEFAGYKDSPTSHARDYLSCYKARRSKNGQREILSEKRMPLYAKPCIMHNGAYVDIKSAWFSILMLAGWDCDYYPHKWFGRGSPPSDFPHATNKVARSALVSLSRSSHVPVFRDGITAMEPMFNIHDNPHIYALICDVLQAIAVMAVKCYGCVYVATDGFIIPSSKVRAFGAFVETWGLTAGIKAEGVGIVLGAGSYCLGSVETRRLIAPSPIDNLDYNVPLGWLHKRI